MGGTAACNHLESPAGFLEQWWHDMAAYAFRERLVAGVSYMGPLCLFSWALSRPRQDFIEFHLKQGVFLVILECLGYVLSAFPFVPCGVEIFIAWLAISRSLLGYISAMK